MGAKSRCKIEDGKMLPPRPTRGENENHNCSLFRNDLKYEQIETLKQLLT